jgi:hypothetical protein
MISIDRMTSKTITSRVYFNGPIIKYLLEQNIDQSLFNNIDETHLMMAVKCGFPFYIIEHFVNIYSDYDLVSKQNIDGKTCINIMKDKNYDSIDECKIIYDMLVNKINQLKNNKLHELNNVCRNLNHKFSDINNLHNIVYRYILK